MLYLKFQKGCYRRGKEWKAEYLMMVSVAEQVEDQSPAVPVNVYSLVEG
jgi:hypothetical protein